MASTLTPDEAAVQLAATSSQRWHPTFHVAPVAGWINDPNGLCFYQGRYHAFFQHYPYEAQWGPMHWGHASSADLVTWRHEPVALAPDAPYDADGVWSGSAIETPSGTLKVFYTGHRWRDGRGPEGGNVQVQCVAESTDGVHFEKAGIVIEGPEDLDDFRDPCVWRHDDRWYLTLGVGFHGRGQVWLYASDDLDHWSFEGVLFEDPSPDVYMLECPQLFQLREHWVLLYGPMTHARPHGYTGRNGHNGGYVVGTWAPGQAFVPLTDYRPADWGRHFYATQTMLDPAGRRLAFGWMGEFVQPLASASEGWAGQLAVPRALTLGDDLRLRWTPIPELESLRGQRRDHGAFEVGLNEDYVIDPDADALEIELKVDLTATTSEAVLLHVHQTAPGCATTIAYDDLAERVQLDLGAVSQGGRGYRSAPFVGDELRLRVLVDRGSVEVFVGDGAETLSTLSFPDDGPRAVVLSSAGGTIAVTGLVTHKLGTIGLS